MKPSIIKNEALSLLVDKSWEEQFEKEVDKDFSLIILATECRHELGSLQSYLMDSKITS